MKASRNLRLALLAIAGAARLHAMQNAVTLRTDTRVVEIDVTVHDSQGKPVEDLRKSDFTITDDGKPREFTIFNFIRSSAGTPQSYPAPMKLPVNTFTNVGQPSPPTQGHSTVILLDAINGWFENYALSRQAVIGMLGKVPVGEKIALYVISKGEGLVILQDYTTDRERLLDAITKYIPHAMCTEPPDYSAPVDPSLPVGSLAPPTKKNSAEDDAAARLAALTAVTGVPACVTPGPRGLDLRASAAESVRTSLSALAAQLARQPGRKSVFWVSQGFPVTVLNGETAPTWNKTFSALNDANVAVNVVDNNGIMGPKRMWGGGAVPAMKQIADATGGRLYFDTNGLDDALAEGIADSRSSYVLGFYLTEVDGKYHELKVSVDRPGTTLNYRQGYYAVDIPKMDASQKKVDLSAALLNPADSTAVGIEATLDAKPGTLNVRVRLDPETLSLQPGKAGQAGKVEELFVEFNAAGHEVGRISAVGPFRITPENRETFKTRGVIMVQSIPLATDAVKLSIVVRDTASGRVGSLAVPLDKVVR
jgi:VWFA-related protein